MASSTSHQKNNIQPIPIFYRPNPYLFVILPLVLKPTEMSIFMEMIFKMDMGNCFEVEDASVSQFIQERFKIDKSEVNKHLKRLAELNLIIFIDVKTRRACRINPAVANRAKYLSGIWEFESIELETELREAYSKWASARGLTDTRLPNLLSVKRLSAAISAKRRHENSNDNSEIKSLKDQIQNMIEAHARESEKWIGEQKEREMQFQALKEEMQLGNEKLRQEMQQLTADIRKTMDEVLSELRKHDPMAADNFKNRHLELVKD